MKPSRPTHNLQMNNVAPHECDSAISHCMTSRAVPELQPMLALHLALKQPLHPGHVTTPSLPFNDELLLHYTSAVTCVTPGIRRKSDQCHQSTQVVKLHKSAPGASCAPGEATATGAHCYRLFLHIVSLLLQPKNTIVQEWQLCRPLAAVRSHCITTMSQ